MFPVKEITLSVLRLLPLVVLEPSRAFVFWAIVFLTAIQYRRLTAGEERAYGAMRNNSLEVAVSGLFHGLGGGLVASLLSMFIGISLTGSGITYLLPLAFALYMINPRLMCFSYAGGIVSLSHLVFGVPRVSVQGVMALVGILHLTESILIRVSGGGCASPLYLRNRAGRVVGGFSLQRFWPMPLIVLIMAATNDTSGMTGLIRMPDWWPLIRPEEAASMPDALFMMVPIVAALGYSDLAVTCSPARKVRRTSLALAVYSVVLLGLAIASGFVRPLRWLAALFGPLGHETVILMGGKRELSGKPAFVPPDRGVMVLDVLPNSAAAGAGLGTGDVITEASGIPVNSRQELMDVVRKTPVFLDLTVTSAGGSVEREVVFRGVVEDLGVITVPEEGDGPHVELRSGSPARDLASRIAGMMRGRIGRR